MEKRKGRWGWVFASAIAGVSMAGMTRSATPPPAPPPPTAAISVESPLTTAFAAATAAANQARTASTPTQWSQVAAAWGEAIAALQTIAPTEPQWLFAQRKTREYLANQAIALQRAETTGTPRVFPPLGNTVLDEQIALYLSYVATFGAPDVLVVGSSRALQGIDPQILQQRLSQQGLEAPTVYTFGVNGATAQVVSFILRQLLTPEQLPRLIVWAEGSRAFNSGRVDRTYAQILASPGYAALQAGDRPQLGYRAPDPDRPAQGHPVPVSAINGYGFLAVSDVFAPADYYRTFPRVTGQYDSSYQAFTLEGVQTESFRAIAAFARAQKLPFIFVNLPLSNDYLDDTRLAYERQFQQYLAAEAAQGDFIVIDWLQEWRDRDQFFADPSHLNALGATQIATKLATHPALPWGQLLATPAD
ncbi:MAG TPA: hypothetical protein V6D02_15030 [Candidatus Obscuribacterales bacterium]